MSLSTISMENLLVEVRSRLTCESTKLSEAELSLIGEIQKLATGGVSIRPLLRDEQEYLAARRTPESSEISGTKFLRWPTSEDMAEFSGALKTVKRFNTSVCLLQNAVVLPNVLQPTASSKLLNVLLQRGGAISDDIVALDIESLASAWSGEIFHLSEASDGRLMPAGNGTASELAIYSLEQRHGLFNELSHELRAYLSELYGLAKGASRLLSITLGARYLLPDGGGTPEHVDALSDTVQSPEGLVSNQQFSIFLFAGTGEQFIVSNPDGSETTQTSQGSLLGFNPTQNHKHPAGHGSWILVIEMLILTPY